jgi:hypothetical protein
MGAPTGPNHQFILLVGGFNHLEHYEFINGEDYPIYETANKTCLKPPDYLPGPSKYQENFGKNPPIAFPGLPQYITRPGHEQVAITPET